MLHYSSIYPIIERKVDNKPVPFDIEFVDKQGARTKWKDVVCTSTHQRPRTINVMGVESRQVRKIRCVSIISINQVEVYV